MILIKLKKKDHHVLKNTFKDGWSYAWGTRGAINNLIN